MLRGEIMLYNSIFHRKSVRKYKKNDVDESTLEQIKTFIASVKPLFTDIKYEIKILTRGEVSNNWAPRYVAIYSEKKPGHLLNAGYLLQQVDLYVQSLGLGSCWIGLARPQESKTKRFGYIIMISVGYPEVDTVRNPSDFKRKNINEITDVDQVELMEAVRLAPSAVNSQPWYFKKSDDSIDVYRNKKGFHALALNTWNQIDVGIAILHLDLSLSNKQIKFEHYKKLSVAKKTGYEYVMSVKYQ